MELYYKVLRNCKLVSRFMVRVLSTEQIKARLRFVAHTYAVRFIKLYELEVLLNELQRRNYEIDASILWCKEILENKKSGLACEFVSRKESFPFFMELARSRKSVRSWTNQPIPDEKVNGLIEAGIEAPCSCNKQSWKFVVTKNKNDIVYLSKLRKLEFVESAPLLIMVLMDKKYYARREREYNVFFDAGAAIQNILLAAQSYGLGACWINAGKYEVGFFAKKRIFKRFGISKDVILVSLIAIGYPSGDIPKPKRAKFQDYIHKFNK